MNYRTEEGHWKWDMKELKRKRVDQSCSKTLKFPELVARIGTEGKTIAMG